VKLYRVLNKNGHTTNTRSAADGIYVKRSSAVRAIAQLKSDSWRSDEPYTIEETEVNWVVSD
jgi:hypothetical protein